MAEPRARFNDFWDATAGNLIVPNSDPSIRFRQAQLTPDDDWAFYATKFPSDHPLSRAAGQAVASNVGVSDMRMRRFERREGDMRRRYIRLAKWIKGRLTRLIIEFENRPHEPADWRPEHTVPEDHYAA